MRPKRQRHALEWIGLDGPTVPSIYPSTVVSLIQAEKTPRRTFTVLKRVEWRTKKVGWLLAFSALFSVRESKCTLVNLSLISWSQSQSK